MAAGPCRALRTCAEVAWRRSAQTPSLSWKPRPGHARLRPLAPHGAGLVGTCTQLFFASQSCEARCRRRASSWARPLRRPPAPHAGGWGVTWCHRNLIPDLCLTAARSRCVAPCCRPCRRPCWPTSAVRCCRRCWYAGSLRPDFKRLKKNSSTCACMGTRL